MMHSLRPLLSACLLGILISATPAAVALDLKIATIAPDGTLWMKEMRKGAEEIARRTGERVNIKFYAGGSMGSDRAVLRKIRAGQLHGGALTGGALSDVYPDAQLYSLPMLFRSEAELDYVKARMDKILAQGVEGRGFVTFGFIYGGFAYLMSNNPIRLAADLKHQKIWVPEGDDISRGLFEALGVSPVPLPITDVLTGLQTGLVSTVASTTSGAIALQWHSKVKYVTDVPALYVYGVLALDKKAWQRLAPGDQKIVREVLDATFANLDKQNRLDDHNAREALRKQGIEFLAMTLDETAKLRKAADDTIERFGKKGAFSLAQLRVVRGHLDDFRRNARR